MSLTLERVTEPAGKRKAFFIPPDELQKAQGWLEKHGLSRAHCTTLCNIHARWLQEPNKPVSHKDIARLYGISRGTAAKLLKVLQAERGYCCERVTKHSGADRGYIMRRSLPDPVSAATSEAAPVNPGNHWQTPADTGEVPQNNAPSSAELHTAAQSSTELHGECSARDTGCPVEDTGVSCARQGGDLYATPTRTSYKKEEQEPFQEQDLSSTRQSAPLQRVIWTKDHGEMFKAALELFGKRQAQTGGAWELEPDDEQQLLEAAKKALGAFQRGNSPESLQTRLADALNRAEAHAWAMGRAFPHDAGRHFGAHLSPDGFEPVRPLSEYPGDSDCHDEHFPAVAWCSEQGQWIATHPGYCGDTFPQQEEPQPQPVPVAASRGLSGLDLEREKQRQLAALQTLMASRT